MSIWVRVGLHKIAVPATLPTARRQRCVLHLERELELSENGEAGIDVGSELICAAAIRYGLYVGPAYPTTFCRVTQGSKQS